MIGPHAPRSSSFRRRGITPAMSPLAVCWTGAASVAFRFRGTRPACPASVFFQTAKDHARHAPAGCLLDGCGVRCLPVSGDAPACPASVCWTGAASVVFQTAGDHARMPRVCLLDGCGVRCLPDGGGSRPHAPRLSAGRVRRPLSSRRRGITPACPASVCWTGAAFVVFWTAGGSRPHAPRPSRR